MVDYQKGSGSFSYHRYHSLNTMQGCPCGVSGTYEGDLAGTIIAIYNMPYYIFAALELKNYTIPLFTEEDRIRYVNAIRACEPVEKMTVSSLGEEKIYTFEDIAVGNLPSDVTVTVDSGRVPNPGSSVSVVKENDGNTALEFNMTARDNDNGRNYYAVLPVQHLEKTPKALRFEFSFKVDSKTPASADICEIIFRSDNGNLATLLPFIGVDRNGNVSMYETNRSLIGVLGKTDEYIDVVFEYEWEKAVYKVYANGEYIGSGTSLYSGGRHNVIGSIAICSASQTVAKYYVDNIRIVTISEAQGVVKNN